MWCEQVEPSSSPLIVTANRLEEPEHLVADGLEHLLRAEIFEPRPVPPILPCGEDRILDRPHPAEKPCARAACAVRPGA